MEPAAARWTSPWSTKKTATSQVLSAPTSSAPLSSAAIPSTAVPSAPAPSAPAAAPSAPASAPLRPAQVPTGQSTFPWQGVWSATSLVVIFVLLLAIVLLIVWITELWPDVTLPPPQPFRTIPFGPKPNLPANPLLWDPALSRFGLCAVMSAVNAELGAPTFFPSYFTRVFPLPSGYGYVATLADPEFGFSHVVALRGTLNKIDWQTDFSWNQVPYLSGLVHRGFLSVAEILLPEISLLLSRARSVCFVGHSLGAAVAEILATTWSADHPRTPAYLYVTGRPRVGNLAWDNLVSETLPRLVLNNGADDIPQLPPPTMPGRKTELNFSYLNAPYPQTVEFWAQTLDIGENHNLETYLYAVSEALTLDPSDPLAQRFVMGPPFPLQEEFLPPSQLLICPPSQETTTEEG